jgi:type I restriction enzyme S subunit
MQVMTENKVVPKLRFGEFKDDWNNHLLDDIAIFLKGKGISKSELDDDGKTECIRYGELYVYYNELIDEVKSKTNLENLVLSEANDIIIPASGETQLDIATASCVLRSGIALGGDLNVIRTENNGLFLSYYLNSKKKFEIARLSQGSSVVHLYASQLKTLKLNLPSLTEQQKIASFLSAVDEKLQQLTKKKKLLEEYKKGVMQQIFSQELLFKDDNGNNYPDWEEKKLGEILIERKELVLKSVGLEHISLTTKGVIPKSKRYMRDFLVNDDSTKKYKVTRLNDICYNPANLKFGVICRNKYGDGIFSPIYVTFEVSKSDTVFMEYFLVRSDFISKARKYEEGTVYERMAVKPSDFISLLVCLPSLEEQKKIAKFLSAIDWKIDLVSTQIENTKAFKKGLLQQMFV